MNAPPTGRGLVGIFAAGRNGSTLLMRLLDGSPDLWLHPVEVNYLSVFSDLARFGRVRGTTIFNATTERPLTLHRPVDTDLLIRRFATHAEQLRQVYGDHVADSPPLVLEGDIFAAVRGQSTCAAGEFLPALLEGTRRVCLPDEPAGQRINAFKSIETPYLDEYARVFTGMRFIHLVREPVANFSSVKRTMTVRRHRPFWYLGGDELQTFLEKRWLPHARWLVEQAQRDQARHYVVRYEDLCEQPSQVLADLCRWLGVRPPADATRPTVLGGRSMVDLPVSSSAGGKTPAAVIADTARAFHYAPVVSKRERQLIGWSTGSLARALGYAPAVAPGTALQRMALACRWLLPDRRELSYPRLNRRLDYPRTALALARRRGWIFARLLRPSAP